MKLQKFRELAKAEKEGVVRKPQNMKFLSQAEIIEKKALLKLIIDLISSKYNYDEMYKVAGYEKHLKSFYNTTGNGTFELPYTLQSNFGEGKFCDLCSYFKSKEYPNFIRKRYCHSNCFEYAKRINSKCKILSGIVCKDYPFLHSVVLIGNYILDFNYDLLMTKDLYVNLFNFEILNELKGEDITVNLHKLEKAKNINLTYAEVNFCFYDIINRIEHNQDLTI